MGGIGFIYMVAASFIAGVNRTTHWGSQLYFPITRYVLKEEGRTLFFLLTVWFTVQ
jgi:hypothetical protein